VIAMAAVLTIALLVQTLFGLRTVITDFVHHTQVSPLLLMRPGLCWHCLVQRTTQRDYLRAGLVPPFLQLRTSVAERVCVHREGVAGYLALHAYSQSEQLTTMFW